MDIWEAVSEAFSGAMDTQSDIDNAINGAYREMMRFIQKELIKHVYAPLKKGERDKIKEEFDEAVKLIASDTKMGLESIKNQLDPEIKGQFGTSIQTSMKNNNSKWDEL